jgi:hypothetical protein
MFRIALICGLGFILLSTAKAQTISSAGAACVKLYLTGEEATCSTTYRCTNGYSSTATASAYFPCPGKDVANSAETGAIVGQTKALGVGVSAIYTLSPLDPGWLLQITSWTYGCSNVVVKLVTNLGTCTEPTTSCKAG